MAGTEPAGDTEEEHTEENDTDVAKEPWTLHHASCTLNPEPGTLYREP